MDVGVWLRGLGLGQYEAPFRDNEIDGSVLPRLTVDDQKDLGVVGSVDHSVAQILRISSSHPCRPPPSQQVKSEQR